MLGITLATLSGGYMKQMIFAGMALVDMAILYAICAVFGFAPSPIAIVVIVAVAYCAFQIHVMRMRRKMAEALAEAVVRAEAQAFAKSIIDEIEHDRQED